MPDHEYTGSENADATSHRGDQGNGAKRSSRQGHEHHRNANADHDHDHGSGLWSRLRRIYQPHSHDASDSIDSALESSERGIRATKISLAGLMITALLQVVIVLFTGSVALLADTIHNFADALTSIPLWIAFVIGRRLANRRYTYGYRRAEDLSGLFIVLMIAFSAILAGWESIRRLIEPVEVKHLGLLAAAGAVGFIGNEIVALYRIRVGRQINSAALIADGYHARTDGLTSLAVVVSAAGVALGFPLADPIIGLLITLAILMILRDASKSVFRRLMDGVEPELVDRIEGEASLVKGVRVVEGVKARWVGHRLDASLEVTVDPEISVATGHAIADEVTKILLAALPQLDHVVVHVDPDGLDHRHSHRRGVAGSKAG